MSGGRLLRGGGAVCGESGGGQPPETGKIKDPQSLAAPGGPFRGLRGESDPPGAFGSFAAAKEHKLCFFYEKKSFDSF